MASSGNNLLREEIITVGARAANQSPEPYLASAATSQIVRDLRRAAEGGASLSPTLAILLKLNDQTLAYAIAALRDTAGERKTDGEQPDEAQAALADALAESYLTNHHLSVMLRAATGQISSMLKRLEKFSVVLESDAASRDALALVGAYELWLTDPDNPTVIELLEELAERVKPVPPSITKLGGESQPQETRPAGG